MADMTLGDIKKEFTASGLEKFTSINSHTFTKLQAISQFIKTFLNSITLLVITPKQGPTTSTHRNGLTKPQDEFAYFKLVESLIRFSLSEPSNYPLLYSVKTFMHKNFLNQKQQEGMMKGTRAYFEALKTKQIVQDIKQNDEEFVTFVIAKIEEKTQGVKKVSKKALEEAVANEVEESKENIEN
jgi:hypothetical protein